MPTTKSNRKMSQQAKVVADAIDNPRELTRDVVDYLTDYARQNPGYAALCCVGVGFILGWKLKPW